MDLNFLLILCVWVFDGMYVCVSCICLVPVGVRKGVIFLGTGVMKNCKLPCGAWESNPGPLNQQPLLLANDPSQQSSQLLMDL